MTIAYDELDDVLLRFAIDHPLPTPEAVELLCARYEGHGDEIRRYAATLLTEAIDPDLGDGSMGPDEEAEIRRRAHEEAGALLTDLRERARTVERRRTAWAGADR